MVKISTTILTLVITAIININAQWQHSLDTIGGIVNDLAAIGTNIFAGSFANGVFISANNGVNWAKVNSGLEDTGIRSMAVSGSNIYTGTWGGGVYRSNDNGTNWIEVSKGLNNKYVSSLAVQDSNIFAGTNGGVYRLAHNDTNWTEINSGLTNNKVTSLAASDTAVYAGTQGKLYKSLNNGTSWTELITSPSGVTALFVNDTNVYVGTAGPDGGVFISTDGGSNWSKNIDVYYVYSIAVKDNYIFIGSNEGIYISTDYGQIWTFTQAEGENGLVYSFLLTDLYVYAGTYGGTIMYQSLSEIMGIDVENGSKINVYPNPAKDILRLGINRKDHDFIKLKIYNPIGFVVKTVMLNPNQSQIDISDLSNGIYIITFSGNKTVSEKLIIQR